MDKTVDKKTKKTNDKDIKKVDKEKVEDNNKDNDNNKHETIAKIVNIMLDVFDTS